MPSLLARIVNRLLPLTGSKTFFADPDKVPGKLAKVAANGPDLPSAKFRRKFAVTEIDIDGYRLFTVAPREPAETGEKHVLYLHGGGYVLDMSWAHWNFIGRLIEATGVTVSAPIYPLAPQHVCEQLVPSMQSLFASLASQFDAGNITVMGDSAGGGLSLALAHALRDAGEAVPERLILLSPWLDVMATDPAQLELENGDPMISVSGLRSFGALYAGDLDAKDPRVSPLFGAQHQLPPIQVFTGTADVLFPDAQRFRDQMIAAGNPVKFHPYEDMFHVWMLIPIPEGKQAMREIAAFMT